LRTPGQHLWRKIANGTFWALTAARSRFTSVNLMHRLCNTKVGDLRTTLPADQNVARRDIAMNDAAHMCGGESACNLCSNRCSAAWHQRTDATQHRGEILAVNKLHHNRW
jgi:hypothetical protein